MNDERKPSILAVDDTPANLQLLVQILSDAGYDVRPVTDGDVALRAVQASKPDLILLDITMPGLSGYEVCARLKDDPSTSDIPIVFLSALSDPLVKVHAFQCGGVDYVTKPFQMDEIVARVRTHLELRSQRLRLTEQNERLVEAERLRDSLVHMVVHDMRSPLLGISLNLELLLLVPELSEDTKRMLSDARHGTRALVRMAEQMLEVSRLESGTMPLERKALALDELVSECFLALRAQAGSRTLRLQTKTFALADGDPALVTRVVENLLTNAIKHTGSNGHITVALEDEADGLRVSVRDDGGGIPAALQADIFEKFSQVRRADARRGYGLGLAFVRLAIEAHGGKVGLESEVGRGSEFWFTLPAVKVDVPARGVSLLA